jgi:hypothetical protein
MTILLVNPPLSEPTGPYPAICYLAGYLETIAHQPILADASLQLLLALFTDDGINQVADDIQARIDTGTLASSQMATTFLERRDHFVRTARTAIACLQGRDPGAMGRASRADYFPPPLDADNAWARDLYFNVQALEAQVGPLTADQRARLAATPDRSSAYGAPGSTDNIRFRASRLLSDVCAVIRDTIDPDFGIDAYAASLTDDCPTFDLIRARLTAPPTALDTMIDSIAADLHAAHQPEVLCLSVPFPGSLQGALRIAAWFKSHAPHIAIVMGGGWVNTQLRHMTDPGIFDYVDFITLDDGEAPLRCVLEVVAKTREVSALKRTFIRRDGHVEFVDDPSIPDVPFAEVGTPTYRGLDLAQYFSFRPTLHAFPRLFGRRWNKLTLARGCYWKRCTFCDTHLPYIGHYDPAAVDIIITRIKRLIEETGDTGFHFVDEAMPPALMARLAERLIAEGLEIAWWGNVRFDSALIPIAPLLARSGCIGVTGGLEAPVERLLSLIDKGVSLDQAAQVCHALSDAGLHVHAYLMYGFPTQTAQDTVDGLEFVRQLFEAGCLSSAFWHRFTLTAFSPIAMKPDAFGISVPPQPPRPFSHYLLDYEEPGRVDHLRYGAGLTRAVDAYMLGAGFDRAAHTWFGFDAPETGVERGRVRRVITRGMKD